MILMFSIMYLLPQIHLETDQFSILFSRKFSTCDSYFMRTMKILKYVSANSILDVYGPMKNIKSTFLKFLFDDLQSKISLDASCTLMVKCQCNT